MVRLLLIALTISLPLGAHTEELRLCNAVKSRGEGDWPIPEHRFNETEAENALVSLRNHLKSKEITADFVNIENDLMIVEGYLLKLYAERDESYVDAFCEFIDKEAYVRH